MFYSVRVRNNFFKQIYNEMPDVWICSVNFLKIKLSISIRMSTLKYFVFYQTLYNTIEPYQTLAKEFFLVAFC